MFFCLMFLMDALSKEKNRQKNVKHLLLRKTDILKTCRKSKFFGKKIWRNAPPLKSKRYKVYLGKRLFWQYCLHLFFVYKTVSQISFNLFCSGDKRLLWEFLKEWGWFQGHNECFPKFLGKKLKFEKTEIWFCRWKSTDNDDINIFMSLENLCTFLLARENTWKWIFNTNSEFRKIV